MKKLLFILFLISSVPIYSQLFPVPTSPQSSPWIYGGTFPIKDTLLQKNSMGGRDLVVDLEKKIWIIPYMQTKADSVFIPDSNKYVKTYPVYVFQKDGSPAPFSPIKLIQTKEKKNKVFSNSKTGILTDVDGNIILSDGNELVRIDYKTGEGINFRKFITQDNSDICKAAVDCNGNIFIAFVQSGHPIIQLCQDFTGDSIAVKTLNSSGTITNVSRDGQKIFAHRSKDACTYVYIRNSDFDPFVLVDTVLKGFKIEASGLDLFHDFLYVSAGSFYDKPLNDPQIPGLFYPNAKPGIYYAIDMHTIPFRIKDTICWRFTKQFSPDERNGGIFLTQSITYLTAFGGNYYPLIQYFSYNYADGISKEPGNSEIKNYYLSQNFPNPFNPSTEIKFTIKKDGVVTLKVYDTLGKEVTTILNKELIAGNYSAIFNAEKLSSGTYIYQLRANDIILCKKMIVLK